MWRKGGLALKEATWRSALSIIVKSDDIAVRESKDGDRGTDLKSRFSEDIQSREFEWIWASVWCDVGFNDWTLQVLWPERRILGLSEIFWAGTVRSGLYFGLFNPIHVWTFDLFADTLYIDELDEVWFVLWAKNPWKSDNLWSRNM